MPLVEIHGPGPSPSPAVVEQLRRLPTSVLSDQLGRSRGLRGIHPLTSPERTARLVGPAFTVRTRPGDNLVVHHAVDVVRAGEVIVIDGGGALDRALVGEIVVSIAAANEAAGIVVDGAIRDAADLVEGPIPVFARAITHVGPHKHGPGELRGPVAVGGCVVHDGDLIVADGDGVVVVPARKTAEVAQRAQGQVEHEARTLRDVRAGTLDRGWVREALGLSGTS